ncbi:MAG TPA: hypothetical protein VLB02_00780 [Candidatus Paceibacterota bacterium]|nr:hypothetical protein [Candidatus Paceibacterota bacterium]
MKKTTQKKGVSAGTVAAIGAGVAAVGAISYYFFGPHGKKHRKQFTGWMIRMKGEVIEKIEKVSEVTEQVYHKIIDSVAAAYVKSGRASEAQVRMYADELKKQWKNIAGSAKKHAKKGKPTAKKKST